jgi:hypothetical protein
MRAAKADHAEAIKIDSHRRRIVLIYPGIKVAGSGRSGVVFPSRPAATPTRTRPVRSRPRVVHLV